MHDEIAKLWKAILAAMTGFAILLLITGGCDTSITGEALENEPPTTSLWVRDSSLVDQLEDRRLTSSVHVHYTGQDPDGYVSHFEIRYYPHQEAGSVGPDDHWIVSLRNDTIVQLPIPPGEAFANAVFEARAVDNLGLKDPTPARTVFPIRNTPPNARLSTFDLPPDTTFTVFSLSWTASDPDGEEDLERIEISLNDSTSFVTLPPDVRFVTLVADFDRDDPAQYETETRVFFGHGFQGTDITVPGLRLNDENTFYMRVADRADTTSQLQRHTWFVRKPASEILVVNDYRVATATAVEPYHLNLIAEYMNLPSTEITHRVDRWDLSDGRGSRNAMLPSNADPTLRETLALYSYIYWFTNNSTNSATQNNFPFAAGVMQRFFENGGRLMVHSPITIPTDRRDAEGNPAILILPINDLVEFPDSLRNQLRLPPGDDLTPVENLPGIGQPLPVIRSKRLITGTLPYVLDPAENIPLYEAPYQYVTRVGANQGPWTGPSTIASISQDGRVGLFAMPLVDERSGDDILGGSDGDPDAPRRAIMMMLESLGFPKN